MTTADPRTGEITEGAPPMYEFDGRTFALTWLTVASAASEDPDMYALCRTVNVELDEGGVRLTSTDGYRFWSQWVGELLSATEPDYELQRAENTIVDDSEFRARDLMKYIAKSTKKEDSPALTLRLTFGPAPREDGQLVGMESQAATFTVSETDTSRLHESLLLPLLDVGFPDLRAIYNAYEAEPATEVSFNPVLLTKMMKAVPGSEDMPCKILLQGPLKAAIVQPWVLDDTWPLRGCLMPTRDERSESNPPTPPTDH